MKIKRLATVVIGLAMILSLVACGSTNNKDAANQLTSSDAKTITIPAAFFSEGIEPIVNEADILQQVKNETKDGTSVSYTNQSVPIVSANSVTDYIENTDGSVTVRVTKEQQGSILRNIKLQAVRLAHDAIGTGDGEIRNIFGADNMSDYMIKIDEEQYSDRSEEVAHDLYIIAYYYQVMAGMPIDKVSVKISFYNYSTNYPITDITMSGDIKMVDFFNTEEANANGMGDVNIPETDYKRVVTTDEEGIHVDEIYAIN